MLTLVWLLSFIFVSSALEHESRKFRAGCKCTSRDDCWPSEAEWNVLSRRLSHPVFKVLPPGYYCHNPHYNAALCASAQENTGNSIWRADQPGAEQSDVWEFTATSSCDIDGNRTTTCGQGRVPALGVNATTVHDIQLALEFAFSRNLKVHVKNTGHDFLGRGLGPGSLMIWTHHFRFQDFSSDFAYATGQRAGFPTVTAGPGMQWVDTYAFAAENNVVVAGGIGPLGSVGSGGGWPLGGGHNILSAHLGLGADNVVEVDLVLPDGRLVTANPYINTDLFWAVRGGGGPSFGVATRIVYQAHPVTPLYASFFEAFSNNTTAYLSVLDLFHASLPGLADAGWCGYYPFEAGTGYFALMYLLPNGNTTYGNATLGTFIRGVASIPGVTIRTDATTTYPNFQSWFIANILDPVDVIGFNYTNNAVAGAGVAPSSWLLPRDLFANETTAHLMSEAMANIPAGIGQHVAGGVVSSRSTDFNALHPTWRTALVDLGAAGFWTDAANETTIQGIRQDITDQMAPFRALTPGNEGAQYLNEPDILIPDYPRANWGTHYERLLRIKRIYDPTNQLLVVQGVGATDWDSEQICPL